MSMQIISGPLTRRSTPRARASSPCTCTRVASPYTLVETFLRRQIDAPPLKRGQWQASGRDELSQLLEIDVTEAGYRLLVAPLLYTDGDRPSDDEIARHARWWLDQLP